MSTRRIPSLLLGIVAAIVIAGCADADDDPLGAVSAPPTSGAPSTSSSGATDSIDDLRAGLTCIFDEDPTIISDGYGFPDFLLFVDHWIRIESVTPASLRMVDKDLVTQHHVAEIEAAAVPDGAPGSLTVPIHPEIIPTLEAAVQVPNVDVFAAQGSTDDQFSRPEEVWFFVAIAPDDFTFLGECGARFNGVFEDSYDDPLAVANAMVHATGDELERILELTPPAPPTTIKQIIPGFNVEAADLDTYEIDINLPPDVSSRDHTVCIRSADTWGLCSVLEPSQVTDGTSPPQAGPINLVIGVPPGSDDPFDVVLLGPDADPATELATITQIPARAFGADRFVSLSLSSVDLDTLTFGAIAMDNTP